MDTEEALRVADKAADRNTPAADHPSIVNMVYALEILANGYRLTRQKAEAWETSSRRMARRAMDATATRDRAVKALESANEELDRTQGEWSGLMEFIRTALGLSPQSLGVDERALCDKTDPRSILGQVFADARLLRRIRDEVNGKFVAGSEVTADACNTLADAVESFTVRLDANESVRINPVGGVYIAPVGTDPKDTDKWTLLRTTPPGGVFVEFQKQSTAAPTKLAKLMGSCAPWTDQPAVQLFPVGSPEPDGRVKRVKRKREESEVFVRVGRLATGRSLWQREDGLRGMFFTWAELVKWREVVEVPE